MSTTVYTAVCVFTPLVARHQWTQQWTVSTLLSTRRMISARWFRGLAEAAFGAAEQSADVVSVGVDDYDAARDGEGSDDEGHGVQERRGQSHDGKGDHDAHARNCSQQGAERDIACKHDDQDANKGPDDRGGPNEGKCRAARGYHAAPAAESDEY